MTSHSGKKTRLDVLLVERGLANSYEEKIAWLRQVLDWHEETGDIHELAEQFSSDVAQDRVNAQWSTQPGEALRNVPDRHRRRHEAMMGAVIAQQHDQIGAQPVRRGDDPVQARQRHPRLAQMRVGERRDAQAPPPRPA